MPTNEESTVAETRNLSQTPAKISWSMSPTIGKLVEALAAAQLDFAPILKENINPAFRSKYSDLATIIAATQKPLANNGLVVMQMTRSDFGQDDAKMLTVTTMLAHTSGEWIASDLALPAMMREVFNSQSVGSAITYGRRYGLQAILGVSAEVDDDSNAAAGIGSKEAANSVAAGKLRKAAEKKGDDAVALTEWKEGLVAVSGGGLAVLKAEIEPEVLKELGFKLDGNVVTIPAGKAFAFEDLCKRAKVELVWSKALKAEA
jgi:hypothetical protein